MERIHWSGGINMPGDTRLQGWPCCCSGPTAYHIRLKGMMNGRDPKEVTCKRCQAVLRKAGLLKGE